MNVIVAVVGLLLGDAVFLPVTGLWLVAGASRADDLEQRFDHPPAAAKPRVMWMWMGNTITKEGITHDLETLHEAGFGGTMMFSLSDVPTTWSADIAKSPTPEVITWSEPWWNLVRHAASESKRLGMDFGMHNCAGYSTSGGPWITPELSMQELCWSETPIKGGASIAMEVSRPKVDPHAVALWPIFNSDKGREEKPIIPARQTYYRDVALLAAPATGTVTRAQVVDLSDHLDAQGRLKWDAPAGNWILYRFGHTTQGTMQYPAQWKANGLECDKMNPEAVAFHVNHIIDEARKHLGDLMGTGFTHFHFDSYEACVPSWTPKLRKEFLQRRGYDLVSFLPIFAKRVVDSDQKTGQFKADFERTIQDLHRDSYFATISRLMRKAGLEFMSEPYGGPWKIDEAAPFVHRITAEFWNDGGRYRPFETDPTIAAARKCNRNIIESEAFTAEPQYSKWSEYPAQIKAVGDEAFCTGINRFTLHRFVHQPWDDRYKPGNAMGQWGTHFDRTQTWWEPGKAIVRYWQRCQALLQWGKYEGGQDAFRILPADAVESGVAVACSSSQPSYPVGNVIDKNPDTFWVSNGEPRTEKPEWISIEYTRPRLVGSVEIAPRPKYGPKDCQFQYSEDGKAWKTLKAMTAGSEQMKVDFEPIKARFFRLLVTSSHSSENTQIRELTILRPGEIPQFAVTPRLKYIQRRGESSELFFVFNTDRTTGGRVTGSFAVSGKQPELWDPVTGTRRDLPEFEQREGRTLIPLEFAPGQSWFVVMRRPSAGTSPRERSGARTRNFPEIVPVAEIGGSWQVTFDAKWGGPAKPVTFTTLDDWTKHPEPGIRYYSGTAVYRTRFDIPTSALRNRESRMYLDLGQVNYFARVRLNGQDLGVVWTAPWRVDISAVVRGKANSLEIEVTNVWANRLIGDEQEPVDCAWNGPALKEWPDWLLKGKPRPSTGRYCFTTWNYFTKDSSLVPSGLLGPVKIVTGKQTEAVSGL